MDVSDEVEQLVIELFFAWDTQRDSPIPFTPLQYSDEPWRSHAAQAWIMGNKIETEDFEKYALSQFILNCGLADMDIFERIERSVPETASLRRFSNHWVAWNHSLAAGESEFGHLEAAKLSNVATPNTRDPRIYDLDHWYLSCGDDINAKCDHDPAVKQAALDASKQKDTPKPQEWGREWELKQNSSKGNPTRSTPSKPRTTTKRARGPKKTP